MAKQTGDFSVKLQILDYPPVDLHSPPELKRNAYATGSLPPERLRLYNDYYIAESSRLEPTASPLFAPMEMLRDLPPALIITCGDDVLGEEAEKYAAKLIEAGVTVTARRFLNSHHGFTVRRLDEFGAAEGLILQALRVAFDK
jgi:acetyl esterase